MLRRWLGLQPPSNLVALHAALAGTQELFVSLGESRARQFLEHTINRLSHRASARGGLVVRSDSTSLLALFEKPEQALEAATALRQELRTWCMDVDPGFQIPLDMGLSSGAVLCRPPHFEGETLLRASSLAAAAQGGETLLDQGVVAALPPQLALRARATLPPIGFSHVGKAWTFEQEPTAPEPEAAPALWLNLRSPDGRLHLSFTPDRPIRVGRDAHADIAVDNPAISRQHAVIVWRNGSYMIADVSRNGTWVRQRASPEPVFVRQGVCLLGNSGSLSLGRPPRGWRAPDLLFSVTPPPFSVVGA